MSFAFVIIDGGSFAFVPPQILVLIIQQTGESSHAEEELLFTFFVQILHDYDQAERYYRYMQDHWPKSYFSLAFFGLFLSEVKLKIVEQPQLRELCIQEADHAFRMACRLINEKGTILRSITRAFSTCGAHERLQLQNTSTKKMDGYWVALLPFSSNTSTLSLRILNLFQRLRIYICALSVQMPVMIRLLQFVPIAKLSLHQLIIDFR